MDVSAPHTLLVETSRPTPERSFHRWFYAAVLRVIEGIFVHADDADDVFDRFPFLAGYLSELAVNGLDGLSLVEGRARWEAAIHAWEADAATHLPLIAIRDAAGLDDVGLTLLIAVGLGEEDARFGALFEQVQETPGLRRPTVGLLSNWWSDPAGGESPREALRTLFDLGLVTVLNPNAPRSEWALQVPAALWEALRGECHASPSVGLRYRPSNDFPPTTNLIVPDDLRSRLQVLPSVLAREEASAIIIRGPRQSGRRTILGAMARELGRGLLEYAGPINSEDGRWRALGPLATALNAIPTVVLEPAPGETIYLPALAGHTDPLGVVLGRRGGVAGPVVERSIVLTTDLPPPEQRSLHWQVGFYGQQMPYLDVFGERVRLTGGMIRRAAAIAQTNAALDGREVATIADVRAACRSLNREALESLATRLEPVGGWDVLAVEAETARDLGDLERRCRHRERIGNVVGVAFGTHLTPGVRALFSGPTGTGKTLAARILAATLGLDLYRLDLAAVVNKYIGETEKRLDEVLTRVEELDVVLLLDEGDALLTARTNVQSANDRYANLETNFLLQRLESFDGIIVVTTNAADRIDDAFQRRMDVVVSFRPPGPAERWSIWQSHLPASHALAPKLLDQIARRCELHGGQIRNAVLHAALLALDDGGTIVSAHVEAAIHREYRKAGLPCPLRGSTVLANGRV